MSDLVLTHREGAVVTVVLNRPARMNAYSAKILGRMAALGW